MICCGVILEIKSKIMPKSSQECFLQMIMSAAKMPDGW